MKDFLGIYVACSLALACSASHSDRGQCCLPSGECVEAGTRDPGNPCRLCDPDVSTARYSNVWSTTCGGREPRVLYAPPGVVDFGNDVSLGPDADGDGIPDLAVAARRHDSEPSAVFLYSGATLELIRRWDDLPPEFHGPAVSLGPDADGDGLGEVLVAIDAGIDTPRTVYLLSSGTGEVLWTWTGELGCRIGGPLRSVLGPDIDGDEVAEALFWSPGSPDPVSGECHSTVVLVSGRSGRELRRWSGPPEPNDADFTSDLNGDGVADIVLGFPGEEGDPGEVRIESSATAERLVEWRGSSARPALGRAVWGVAGVHEDLGALSLAFLPADPPTERTVALALGTDGSVTPLGPAWWLSVAPDLTGDGRSDVLVSDRDGIAVRTCCPAREVRRFTGTVDGEDIGGAALSAGADIDGDGRADIAVGDPWPGLDRDGRVVLLLSGS